MMTNRFKQAASLLMLIFFLSQLSGCAVVHDRRSTGSVIDDQEIEFRALALLHEHDDIRNKSNISITSYNQRVLLTGQAANQQVSQRFANLVSRLPRVQKVFNEITIGAEGTWSEAVDDAYLTSKAKVYLIEIDLEGFDPTRVKVVTSLDTVYLMGLVTRKEADLVADKVRYLSGVKRVVKLFEYIPG